MIRLIKPYISFDEVEAEFREIFDSGYFTLGKWSRLFPERLRAYTGARHAFNATSATTALSACLDALGVGGGDEVVVSDFSFPATVNVVEACGARPVFADVSLETYNAAPDVVGSRITEKTRAVIFVLALGNPDGLDAGRDVCRARGVPLIVDAACGLGSRIGGVPVGAVGDMTCFSFHPRKLLTAGEGGAITTDDDRIAEMLRVRLAHGAEATDGGTEFVTYGYNYRLPELQCVMLVKQLERLDGIVARRIAQQEAYRRLLEPHGWTAQRHAENVLHNMQSVVFTVPDGADRDALIPALRERGVETTLGTYCQSACRYYREKYDDVQPNALRLQRATLTLPCHDGVDAEAVAEIIRDVSER
jgi:dTDP-4-amino-4,6-dideoxygalactose transaminase